MQEQPTNPQSMAEYSASRSTPPSLHREEGAPLLLSSLRSSLMTVITQLWVFLVGGIISIRRLQTLYVLSSCFRTLCWFLYIHLYNLRLRCILWHSNTTLHACTSSVIPPQTGIFVLSALLLREVLLRTYFMMRFIFPSLT